MRGRYLPVMCLVAAVVALLVGLIAWLDNPTVEVGAADLGAPGPAGRVGCSIAPWDAGLNGNDAGPGGEHASAYFEEVGADCYDANWRGSASGSARVSWPSCCWGSDSLSWSGDGDPAA